MFELEKKVVTKEKKVINVEDKLGVVKSFNTMREAGEGLTFQAIGGVA